MDYGDHWKPAKLVRASSRGRNSILMGMHGKIKYKPKKTRSCVVDGACRRKLFAGLIVIVTLLVMLVTAMNPTILPIEILPVGQRKTTAPAPTYKNIPQLIPRNEIILCIFSGRWPFLRINFPYIFRDLRKNGGVLDKVYYILIEYDQGTLSQLTNLTREANSLVEEDSTTSGMSFMNARKSNGPKTVPWGTPDVTSAWEE